MNKDYFYLKLAKLSAERSKDPSTKVGAVVVNGNFEFLGYNGFPRKTNDDHTQYSNRSLKLSKIIHAEINACIKAGNLAEGATLYTWPLMPCDRCAAHVIQYQVARVVAPKPSKELESRWGECLHLARSYLEEAGVELVEYEIDLADKFWKEI